MSEPTVAAIYASGTRPGALLITEDERKRMTLSRQRLTEAARRQPVYGLTRGFGPLADERADTDPAAHAAGLIDHLTAGQGPPLPIDATRLMVWLRLRSAALGHSGVAPELWDRLCEQWNAGFTPVVPQDGSLSASGDLIPLAHAAQAAAGRGRAWRLDDGEPTPAPAAEVLGELGLAPVAWEARSALAFVNGTAASLARVACNHIRLAALAAAAAAASGRLAALLGSDPEPFGDVVAEVRGHPGHRVAARLMRQETTHRSAATVLRPFQEPYSLRCAPQVVGAVLDQLRIQETVLVTEAAGCTDNPIVTEDRVVHGGNFHAAPVAFVSEQHAVSVHQLAYLLERQLAITVDPRRNGGLPALLAAEPGRTSGLAGVQIAATSHLAAIRQAAYPASCTPLPTNLDNQDHVPMALNSANAVADMLDRAWLVTASLGLALTQMHHRSCGWPPAGLWGRLAAITPPLHADRPLDGEVREVAAAMERHFGEAEARA